MTDTKKSESQQIIRESKVAGDVLRARIWENYEKANSDFMERYDRNFTELSRLLEERGSRRAVAWNKIPAGALKRIGLYFKERGAVQDEKGLDDGIGCILESMARLRAATDLKVLKCSHDGVHRLETLYANLYGASTVEAKLMWAMRALGMVLQHNDLATKLVEDGYVSDPGQESEDEEPEDIDPDMPVDSKGFLLNLDQRGIERKEELGKINAWSKTGEWYVPYTSTGYQTDFYSEANYKHFEKNYPFLNKQSGGLGFDTGTFPEDYDTFVMFLSQIDQLEWESFIEDLGVVAEGMCVDEDEAHKLEQKETERYVEEYFLPDFKQELEELPQFQDSFAQYAITQITVSQVWELMEENGEYPESQGDGSVFIRSENLAKGLGLDELLDLFKGVPLKEQWEAEKKKFYDSAEGAWFDTLLATAVAANPQAQHAYSGLASEDVFLLLKSLVPDSVFGELDAPCWAQVSQRVGNGEYEKRWVVTLAIPRLDAHVWHEYVRSALEIVARRAVEVLPTWARPIADHPELRLGEALDPDAVDPRDYLNAVSAYWGIGHQNGARTVWYTGNPWDKWSFEIGDAKQFKSQEEAASFSKSFGPNWHVDIKPIRLPDLHQPDLQQEATDPDAVDPKAYLGSLKRKYVARFNDRRIIRSPEGALLGVENVSLWFSDNPFGWWPDRAKAKLYDSPKETYEVYLGLPNFKRKAVVIEPAEIVSEARKRDSDLPPDEDIDYKSWVTHGGYDSGRELFSDEEVRVFIPSTTHTLEKYGFTVRNGSNEEWDRIVEPGPFFLVIPTKGEPWVIREYYDEIRELAKDGRQYTAWPDEVVKTHSEGKKAGAVIAKYFKKKLKSDFDKYFKWVFQFGGLSAVKGYLKNIKPGQYAELDNLIGIAAALEGKLGTASKFWRYPRELLSKTGAWIYYDDYNDLAALFMDERHSSWREAAEKVFGGEMYDWFDFLWGETYPPKDITGYLTPQHYEQLRKVLVGRSILIDDEPVMLNRETLSQYTDREIEGWLDDYEDVQDGNDLEEIADALSTATKRALETIYEDAYFKGYLKEVTDALSSEYKWMSVGGKDKLAFFVPWKSIREMLTAYEENNNEPYQGSLGDLPGEALKLEPSDEYHGSLSDDKQVVIDSLTEQLSELEPKEAPRDPAQPELFKALPGTGDTVHVQIYSEDYPNGAMVRMKEGDWLQLKQTNPEKTSKEAWDAYAKEHNIKPKSGLVESGPDEIDAKEFIQRMPLRYVITNEWEYPSGKFTDYWAEKGGWANDIEWATYYASYDEAKREYDRMMAGDVTSQFRLETNIKPVYESLDPDALDARQYISDLAVEYVIAHRFSRFTDYWAKGYGWNEFKYARRFSTREEAQKMFDEIFADMSGLLPKALAAAGVFKANTWIEAVDPAIQEAKLQESLLMEGYRYAVTLIPLPREIADFVMTWGEANIPDEWLYRKEGDDTMGRELEPHITVKYGLTVNDVPDELRQICATTRPFPIFFEKVSLFNTNPDYDVLKIDIESPWLQELNKRIAAAVPNENKFPEYHPHATLAYVKKGVADGLVGTDIFAGGECKPQFTAMGVLFKGATEDKDDPNRTKESLLFSTVKKPQVRESAERIVSVAVRLPDGIVLSGPTHDYCWADAMESGRLNDYLPKPFDDFGSKSEAWETLVSAGIVEKSMDGFMTSAGRFVNRQEGLAIANSAQQLRPDSDARTHLDADDLEEGFDPDAVDAKSYIRSLKRPFAISYTSQRSSHTLYFKGLDNLASMDFLVNWTNNPESAKAFATPAEAQKVISDNERRRDAATSYGGLSDVAYKVIPLPVIQQEAGPDDVSPKDYLNQVPVDACNYCGQDLGLPNSIRRDYYGKEGFGEVTSCMGHMDKEGYFDPDESAEGDLTGFDLRDDSDFCGNCGRSLLTGNLAEAGPDDISARDYIRQMPLYYIVKGKMNPEHLASAKRAAEEGNDEPLSSFSHTYYFDSAGGTRMSSQRMTHGRALQVLHQARQEHPYFDVEMIPAEDQSQMYWQGRRTPQEIGESSRSIILGEAEGSGLTNKASGKSTDDVVDRVAKPNLISEVSEPDAPDIDPDEVAPKDYLQEIPVQYVIRWHKTAEPGWYWNNQWGWTTSLVGATRYSDRVQAEDMIRERGLQGYAQVEPLINESVPDPFGHLPFPTDAAQTIRFLRKKRSAAQVL